MKDPIDSLSRKDALDKLKKIRDTIWPVSEIANGERTLHFLSSHGVLDLVKEQFEEPLRMLPDYEIDDFYKQKIGSKP